MTWARMREFGSFGNGSSPVMRTVPETPIRNLVVRCRVYESHAGTGARRIVQPAPKRAPPVYTVNEPACVPADQVVADVTAPPVGPGNV